MLLILGISCSKGAITPWLQGSCWQFCLFSYSWGLFLFNPIYPRWGSFIFFVFFFSPSPSLNCYCVMCACVVQYVTVTFGSFHLKNNTGGLLFKMNDSNMQYVTSTSFLLLTYAKYLTSAHMVVNCGGTTVTPKTLRSIAKNQVEKWDLITPF